MNEMPRVRNVRYYATVMEDVTFESGVVLAKGMRVLVEHEAQGGRGIKWRDGEGTHVAAVSPSVLSRPW